MEDNIQIITIPVHTDIDPSTLLDIAIGLIREIEAQIDSVCGYGHTEGHVLEEEISVEDGDTLLGGE